jgi:hypothetical protein
MMFNIAMVAVICSIAGTRAGYIGYPAQTLAHADKGLSVASIKSIANSGGAEHIAAVKHVAELPQQVVPIQNLPIQTLPFQHATVKHDILPIQHAPVQHETVVEHEEVHKIAPIHYTSFPVQHATYHQASFPIQHVQHFSSLPIKKTFISSFPSQKTYMSSHY